MKESKILLVDDEPFTRQFMHIMLERYGYKNIIDAVSGEDALHKLGLDILESDDISIYITEGEFDLVLLDIVLPGVSGFEVCRRIKAYFDTLPVILLTALAGEEEHTEGVKAGADAFEKKPVNKENLFALIKNLLGHKGREDKVQADYEALKELHKTLPPYVLKKTDYIGDYKVIKTLGKGATSLVYGVCKKGQSDVVALKILNSKEMHSPESISLFRQEVHNISLLKHKAIVPMYEQGIHEGFPYYVMEKVDGRDLAWVLNQDRDYLPFSMVLKIAQQLAEVLDYIHSEDLIHRDIKLENIILDEYENIRLTDFGLSIDTSMSHPDYSKIVGTPLYLAPEIIIGRGEDLKVDIYAYGIVMFLLLTGRAPFEDTDVHSLMHHHCNTTPPRVDEIRSDIPMAWGDFIEACLLKNPKKRPNSLLEFTEDFRFLQYAVY